MKNTMKRILCTVLVAVMLVTGMPFISFGANTLDVTLDISEHTFIDFPAENTPIPFGETTLSFSGEVYNFISIKVECIDYNENIQTKTINDLTNPDVNISFSMPSTPKKIIIKFYSIIDVTLEQIGKIFYFTDKLSTFKIDVNNIGSKSFSENDAENKIKCYTSVKINPLNPFYPNGTANMYYAEYSYDLPAVKQFPSGYNFEEDSYRFKNYSDTISKKYFTTLYGNDNGKLLYKNEKSQGGLCFGFSYTTASIYNGLPDCSYISTIDEGLFNYKLCDNIREILNLSVDFLEFTNHTTNFSSSAFVVGDKTITIEDFIKYAQIYQYSENVTNGSVWCNNANDILNLVKSYTNDDLIGVTIGMTHDTEGGHRVLAVGYEGNDILVDDPNYKNEYKRIHVNADGSWSFNGLSNWNSNNCDIRYNLDFFMPYKLLLTGTTTTVAERWIDDKYNVSEHYIEGMDILNEDNCLIAITADNYSIENDNLTKIITEEIETDKKEDDADLYWVTSDKKITIDNFQGNDNLIEFSGDGKILSLSTSMNGSVTFDIEKSEIEIASTESEEYQLSIENCYSDAEYNDIGVIASITGTASGSEITATQTDSGLLVTGISDGTVTLTKDDEVIETQEIKDAVGEIEITYDKTGEDEDVELDYHSHSYSSSITTPATHTSEGVETFTCDCGDSYTKPVAKLEGHTHTVTNTVAPTCTKNGLTVYTCACGDSYSETVKAKGHSYGDDGVCVNCDDYNKAYDKTANDSENCSHLCHKGGFMGFIWKIVQIFIRLFKTNPVCECGAAHY